MSDSELLLEISDMLDKKLKPLEFNMQELNKRVTNLELIIENETNRNIQLLAENHITLIDKLN